MGQLVGEICAVVIASILGACSMLDDKNALEFRSLKIIDGRFDRSVIIAPAGTPLMLDVELIGPQPVTVSIPALGIGATTVPANWVNLNSLHDTTGDLRKARIILRSLKPGEYQIDCDCYGQIATARFVVE